MNINRHERITVQNSTYPKVAVQWLNHSDSFASVKSPALRVAAER